MSKSERLIFLSCASLAATSAMTLFSYVLSAVCKKNYREPQHLAGLAQEDDPAGSPLKYRATGWLLHYTAGVIWATAYAVPIGKHRLSARTRSTILGAGSGILAGMVWKLALNRHPATARRVHPTFFVQLVPAHVVFGIALRLCERLAAKPSRVGQE